jgi:hypothetical protein
MRCRSGAVVGLRRRGAIQLMLHGLKSLLLRLEGQLLGDQGLLVGRRRRGPGAPAGAGGAAGGLQPGHMLMVPVQGL